MTCVKSQAEYMYLLLLLHYFLTRHRAKLNRAKYLWFERCRFRALLRVYRYLSNLDASIEYTYDV